MEKSFVHYLTKVLVDVMFFGGIACCAAVPFVVSGFGYGEREKIPMMVILISAGLCAEYILLQLKRIFRTLTAGEPFVSGNVSCLRRCAVASLTIAVIFIVKLILLRFTMSSSLIVIIFALLGLFSLTLKDVFKQAVFYKEENEWTI